MKLTLFSILAAMSAGVRLNEDNNDLGLVELAQVGSEGVMGALVEAFLGRPRPPPIRDINEGPNINIVDNGKQHINPGAANTKPKVKINYVGRQT